MWPEDCPRKKEGCEPFANIVADDGSSFVCCGESDPSSRTVLQDKFRLCFVTPDTDTCYDHDETDLLDLLAVISDALSTARRMSHE